MLRSLSCGELRSLASSSGITVQRMQRCRLTVLRKLVASRRFSVKSMTLQDLFCGMGGVSHGALQAGVSVVQAYDYDDASCATYKLKLPGVVAKVDLSRGFPSRPCANCWWASTPCQPFSMLGLKKGFRDERGKLTRQFVNAITEQKPTAFVLENSPHIRNVNGGRDYKWIQKQLAASGYKLKEFILNAADHGVPQNRVRLFLVGLRHQSTKNLKMPAKRIAKPLGTVLKKPVRRAVSKTIRARGGGLNVGDPRCFEMVEMLDGTWERLSIADKLKVQGFSVSTRFPAGMSATIKSKLIGNAVPPSVAAVVLNAVKAALSVGVA